MAQELKRLPAYFYRTDSGREPVREWLQGPQASRSEDHPRRHQGG